MNKLLLWFQSSLEFLCKKMKRQAEDVDVVHVLDSEEERCNFSVLVEKGAISNVVLDVSHAKVLKQKNITNYFKKPTKKKKSNYVSHLIQAPSLDWFQDKMSLLKESDISDQAALLEQEITVPVPIFKKFELAASSPVKIKQKDKLSFNMITTMEGHEGHMLGQVLVPIGNNKKSSIVAIGTQTRRQLQISLSFLKSMLQKSTRMGRAAQAVRISKVMIYQYSFLEFLRRIHVIVVEDTILHPCLPMLTWMMIYYGGKQFSAETEVHVPKLFIDICLQIVYDIASVTIRESLNNYNDFVCEDEIHSLFIKKSFSNVTEQEINLCRCLFLRSCFGGMGGDVKLLQSQSYLWYLRFSKSVSLPVSLDDIKTFKQLKIPTIFQRYLNESHYSSCSDWYKYLCHSFYGNRTEQDAQVMSNLTKDRTCGLIYEDIPLTSADFHCFPELMTKCCEISNWSGSENQLNEMVQHIIWHKGSKINVRSIIATCTDVPPQTSWMEVEWNNLTSEEQNLWDQTLSKQMRKLYLDVIIQHCCKQRFFYQ